MFIFTIVFNCLLFHFRFTGGFEVHFQGPGASDADWPPCLLCHPDLCHHRPGVLLGGPPQDMLQHCRFRYQDVSALVQHSRN